nr:hypothetical protein [Evansella caseinilytica]
MRPYVHNTAALVTSYYRSNRQVFFGAGTAIFSEASINAVDWSVGPFTADWNNTSAAQAGILIKVAKAYARRSPWEVTGSNRRANLHRIFSAVKTSHYSLAKLL